MLEPFASLAYHLRHDACLCIAGLTAMVPPDRKLPVLDRRHYRLKWHWVEYKRNVWQILLQRSVNRQTLAQWPPRY